MNARAVRSLSRRALQPLMLISCRKTYIIMCLNRTPELGTCLMPCFCEKLYSLIPDSGHEGGSLPPTIPSSRMHIKTSMTSVLSITLDCLRADTEGKIFSPCSPCGPLRPSAAATLRRLRQHMPGHPLSAALLLSPPLCTETLPWLHRISRTHLGSLVFGPVLRP